MVQQPSYWKVLTRRKTLSTDGVETETKLNRVLGIYDLTALGVGSTLGAGVYVLAGQVAKDQAGPSVVISFAIAALASLLAGVCYAEFGARVPKAGSAYVYSYVCIGEFAAFVIGWNLILEYIIGTAAVCRGISLYLDTLINDTLKTTFAEIVPMEVSFLGSYFDIFAFALVVAFGVALAFGVETSAMANNFCTCLNISVLLFVIIAGSIKANFANWSIDVGALNSTIPSNGAAETTSQLGAGGFFPFGFSGTLKGAATCFFGFVGFDCIATTGEEVRNPRKNIPRSILLSLLVIFLCYFGVSMVLTLMVPYYRQDPNAPLPYAFKEVGWDFAMWICSIGGLIGLLASLFGALFPLPRIMYSMAEDGLIFYFLGKVSPRFQVPVVGSIFAAILTGLIAGIFDLSQLVNLLSIGTLLAYSVVAISITILRYMDNSENCDKMNGNPPAATETTMLTSSGSKITFKSLLTQLFNCECLEKPSILSTRIVGTLIMIFCLLSLAIGLVLIQAYEALVSNEIWVLVTLGVLVVLTILVLFLMCLQPREVFAPLISVFRVPLVPIVPAISMFINIYLMLQLDTMTWIRFGIWMIIGIPMYFACYCMNDLKNPLKRNPHRIAFEKALRSSASDIGRNDGAGIAAAGGGGNLSGYILKDLEASDANKKIPNGKPSSNPAAMIVAQNQLSLRSLDEIVNMSEIGEELIEMRHRNGKVFYIEDTRSNISTSTLEREEREKHGNGNDRYAKGLHGNEEASDEEKSVIALLDDVLQGEDDGGGVGGGAAASSLLPPTPTASNVHDFNRKFSVDSAMLPSVIETTIVATVHSSSDSSEHDLDDVPEDNDEEQQAGGCTNDAMINQLEYRAECARLAAQIIDDILECDAVQNILGQKTTDTAAEANTVARKASESSMLSSTQSIDDPLHSERFKNKLSQLILQTPMVNSNGTLKMPKEEETDQRKRPKLKHSSSEPDVALLRKSSRTEFMQNNDDGDSTNQLTNSDKNNNNTANRINVIPKPPKFDPILYNTINTLNTQRVRPSLEKLIAQAGGGASTVVSSKNPNVETDFVPFKTKLEAILKRGPSHRTQQRPEVQIRAPKTPQTSRPKTLTAKEHGQSANELNNRAKTPQENSTTAAAAMTAEQLIANARKTLRPVKSGALIS